MTRVTALRFMMKKVIELQIDNTLDGRKIRYVLRNHMGLSVRLIRLMKYTQDGILLNGKEAKQDTQVKTEDILRLTMEDTPSENIEPIELPLHILFEDADIIALNKPRNMPTHPSQNHHGDTLANALAYYFRDMDFTFRVITRLDKDTSGIVLVAKNAMAAQKLSMAMQNGAIQKEYVAAVCGVPLPSEGTITMPIKRKEDSVIVRCAAPDGKEAVTDYYTEKTKNGVSFVRLLPRTGRTHQLRVHMQYIGTPIFGDDLYGAPQSDEKTRLHCRKLSFPHPVSGEIIRIEAPVPEDMDMLFL